MRQSRIIPSIVTTHRVLWRWAGLALLTALPVTGYAQSLTLPVPGALPTIPTPVLGTAAVSATLGVAGADLQILNKRRLTLPLLGVQLQVFKILDTRTGETKTLALDTDGTEVDYPALLRQEQARHTEKYGNLHIALYDLLEQGGNEAIPVLLQLNVPDAALDKHTLHADTALEAAAERVKSSNRQQVQQAAELFRRLFAKAGLKMPAAFTQSGPFITTTLLPEAIRALAHEADVLFIGLHNEKEIPDYPTIAESLPTTRTDDVQSSGVKGAGVKIAVLENGTTNVDTACFNIGVTQDSGAGSNDHMTKSVGIIGNRYQDGACTGSWQGYAPQATVLLANVADYTERYEWAKAQGVNVVTMSWHYPSEETSGSLHSRDIYFDYATTHYPWPTVFTSAGNEAPTAYASGKGYNFLGVGNVVNDGDGNRCNDVISGSSSWKDPSTPHGDREVPEIASPGSRHALLGSSFGGTSAATPVTAAIASLLMSNNSSLKIWPEAIRAILLATANYQRADNANWSKSADGKDGTGMTNAYYANLTAQRRETTTTARYRAHDYGTMYASQFDGGFFEKAWKARTYTTSSRIRVALTWNSKTTDSSSMLDADLDLWVYDPDMHLVATSTTWDSSHEFVEFTPAKVGAYTIKVRGYTVPDAFWSYYGIAWTTHYDLCQ
jgi:hypothetical protein